MGADNWAICPRCKRKERERIDALKSELDDAYGAVALAEFDQMRAIYENAVSEFSGWHNDTKHASFREDYEIYGASEGVVVVSYAGKCTNCGLGTDFKFEEALDDD